MADSKTTTSASPPAMEAAPPSAEATADSQPRPQRPRGPPLHQIYALPAPIRTFPLPSFYPNNPLSLFHLVYAWAKQVLSPPPAEPSIHTGVWDPDTRSVHITDPVAVRAFWEQGFYGKGNLSRSEPNWLKREQIRRGSAQGDVSEQRTALRREERRQVKWERARVEQEALERTRRQEAGLAAPLDEPTSLSTQAEEESKASLTSMEEPETLEEAIVDEPVNVTEPVVEDSTSAPAADDEESDASLNGIQTESHTHDSPPVLLDTPADPVADRVAEITALAVSQVVSSRPSVISSSPSIPKAPVGPLELLALPNSAAEVSRPSTTPVPEAITVIHETHVAWKTKAPVGPLELLALPNSEAEMQLASKLVPILDHVTLEEIIAVTEAVEAPRDTAPVVSTPPESPSSTVPLWKSPVGPLELLALPNSLSDIADGYAKSSGLNGPPKRLRNDLNDATSTTGEPKAHASGEETSRANGYAVNGPGNGSIFGDIITGAVKLQVVASKHEVPEEQPPKRRRKSVRFSEKVESTTFLHCDPPSPDRSAAKSNGTAVQLEAISIPEAAVAMQEEASAAQDKPKDAASMSKPLSETSSHPDITEIENKEHLQLSTEEAFFLSYGIGALSIVDKDTNKPVPREKLLSLFRSHSYFPPAEELRPNDPFLVHYAVYHHFRSLGWVPRHGIKFGVDWMLYTRGPVFDHAEFGLIVMPSYSHPQWKELGQEAPRKSWHALHGVNRVLSHVLKSLVLVYVDVPPPAVFDAAMAKGGISAALKEYKVREFMVRRWSSNRNR
ncbi:tRNA intron endonuclease [Coniochaeta sp. 2T2.1]|nr:tRNA intron endonuclease [Coniochaeta sp. 2T2.1]